jgi:hypothetical protein
MSVSEELEKVIAENNGNVRDALNKTLFQLQALQNKVNNVLDLDYGDVMSEYDTVNDILFHIKTILK